ncbi:MAG: hypothetical protein IJP11_02615 [Oscillospiraceae bacterium]|nr:hypothetical protein [Oscillospiraceae bacterium]
MPDFQFSGHTFSEADVKKLLYSKEGQQLLSLLNRDGGTKLRQAADALKSGNTERMQQILTPILQTEEATALLERLDRG